MACLMHQSGSVKASWFHEVLIIRKDPMSQRNEFGRLLPRSVALAALAVSLWSPAAGAQSFNFQELGYNTTPGNCAWGGQTTIPSIYNGYTFTGFNALDLGDYLFSESNDGVLGQCFVNGRQHPTNYTVGPERQMTGYQQQMMGRNSMPRQVLAVSNGSGVYSFGNAAGFSLNNILLGAGWGNVQSLQLVGTLAGNEIWNANFSFLGLGGSYSTYSNTSIIDNLTFRVTYAGAQSPNFDPYGTVIEQSGYGLPSPSPYRTFYMDNIVTTVPEPSTYAMMATGLAALAFASRRRRKV